ncbi:MAG TPA: DMT family transporter [Vicinamibacteria bacterium]|nr:DMT family transporter [Vicinamibacteria bacterium]
MFSLHLIYMILSGLAFACLDLVRKMLAGRLEPLALVFFMSLGAVPLTGTLVAVYGAGRPTVGYLVPGLGALVLSFAGSLGFIHSVKISPLSRTIPLLSLTPVFTAVMAVPLLGERPSGRQALGIALVVIGAMALNSDGNLVRPLVGLVREKGALIMTGVALLWSISGPLDKKAIDQASVYFHASVMTIGVALGALGILAVQRQISSLETGRRHIVLLGASMIAVTLALTFQLLAIQHVLVSLVEAMKRALGSLTALVLGRLVFGETIHPVQVAAVVVMVAGVFFVLA